MSDDLLNAMEELARASMTIRNLAEGIPGEVVLDQSDYESPADLIKEMHQGQIHMALLGWRRCHDQHIVRYGMKPNVDIQQAAWFRNKPDGSGTDWIRCTIGTRFGLRAVFWNVKREGEIQHKMSGNLVRRN